MGIGGDHREHLALAGADIGLDPPTLVGEGLRMIAIARIGDGEATGDGDAGPTLHRTFIVHDVPALAHEPGHELVGGSHLLERDDVGSGVVEPLGHALAGRRPEAVHIDGRESQHLPIVARPGFLRVRPAR